jgi:flagellar biosynthetic protein FliP
MSQHLQSTELCRAMATRRALCCATLAALLACTWTSLTSGMPMAQESVPGEASPAAAPLVTAPAATPSPPPGIPPIKPVPLETKPRDVAPTQTDPAESQPPAPQPLAAAPEVEGAPEVNRAPQVDTHVSPGQTSQFTLPGGLGSPEEWTSPEGISSALQTLALLTVVSLAPAVLMMTTCFVRIVIVLGLLRQSLGTQQLPSNQVVTSLALFMTLLIMAPVWNQVYDDAVLPYTSHEITLEDAWEAGIKPVRGFMSAQIERTGNSGDVFLFYKYLPADTPSPSSYDDVPITVLLPAFMISELKTAFLIGFQIFLPFLVIDLVVSCVTISMGMFMVPPVLVSLPMKLLLFVLVDGWHLVVGMLMDSFQLVA